MDDDHFCIKCKTKLDTNTNFCPKCGSEVTQENDQEKIRYQKDGNSIESRGLQRPRSNWWYLLAILLTPIGGIIAYFAIRGDDPSKAKNCLIIGFILFGIGLAVGMGSGF